MARVVAKLCVSFQRKLIQASVLRTFAWQQIFTMSLTGRTTTRRFDGIMVPFKTVSNNIASGDVVMRVTDVKFDVEVPDSVFHKPAKSRKPKPGRK